ncbi:MAG TPA: DNA polymerase III subunit beta [Sphaerochaeta sp.]|jgi:DNA polymerase-3 subunit beta|nr:DNA polymerase III subunit beta [Sphaerochaeta sp.]HOQ94330.1 DNA polymerase III subunit beta [Sphaerochaeta sp.]HQB90203.1 DNA polymerase III subunit beta [Sphaerochaeta sp.]
MKFVCTKETILTEIIYAMNFTSQKNALSITSNVFFQTKGSSLSIKATDTKVGFSTEISVDVLEEGKALVSCTKLLEILRTLPDGNVTFTSSNGTFAIKPEAQGIDFKLRTITSDEFPALERGDDLTYFTVEQKAFTEMIDQTYFAAAEDDSRQFLNGVFLERSKTGMTMVATDGRRLSIVERSFEDEIDDFQAIIIPTKFLIELRRLASGEGTLRLSITDKLLFSIVGNRVFYTTLIKGDYPNYRRVIPESQRYQATMRIQDMLDALKRVSLLVENKARRVYLDISEAGALLTSDENESGEAKEIIACQYEGPESRISLNYTYLMTPLKVMDGEYFTLNFTEPTRALTVVPDGERDYLHLIMPMQQNP